MGTTNRAEELAKELSERLERLCEGLAISGDSPSKETILNYFNELNNYRQSEIDELTKSRDDWKFSTEEFRKRFLYKCDEKAELTKEVERLRKGIDWTRAEYIKCVNDSDEITEKLEELLTTH